MRVIKASGAGLNVRGRGPRQRSGAMALRIPRGLRITAPKNPGEPADLLSPMPYARIRNLRRCAADGLPIESICMGVASMAVEVSEPTWDCCGEMHVSEWRGEGTTRAEAVRNAFESLWHEGLISPAIHGVWPFSPSGPHEPWSAR